MAATLATVATHGDDVSCDRYGRGVGDQNDGPAVTATPAVTTLEAVAAQPAVRRKRVGADQTVGMQVDKPAIASVAFAGRVER